MPWAAALTNPFLCVHSAAWTVGGSSFVWLPPDFRAVFVERLTVRREQRLPPSRKVAAPTGRAQFHGSGSMPSQRAAEQGRSNAHHRTRFLCRVGVLNRQSGVLQVG